MANKKWTNEEIENLVDLYNSGKDTSELAEMFECSAYIIRTRLKEQGITLRKYSNNRVYKSKAIVKLSTWESKVGTPEFDYFIGVLAADGCIINTCIALEVKDLELINNYHIFLDKSCNINSKISKVNGNVYYNIKYKNKEIVEFLSNYGIIPKKSNILDNNNSEMYHLLEAGGVYEYIAKSLAVVILNGIVFLGLTLLCRLIFFVLAQTVKDLTKLPIVRWIK